MTVINNSNNGKKNSCPAPSINGVKDGTARMILQPLQQSKFIKLHYSGLNDGVIDIGDSAGQPLLYFFNQGVQPIKLPDNDRDLAILQLFNGSDDLSKLICYIRIQVSQSWVGLFGIDPIYLGANEDGVIKPEPINLTDFVNEYSYRDLVLSVPVKFLIDTKHAFFWDLTALGQEAIEGSLTITLYIQKEFNRIYHID